MTGKTIRIYRLDGMPTSTPTAEMMKWTGAVTFCPRPLHAALGVTGPAALSTP